MTKNRVHYRKSLRASGHVVREGEEIAFKLLDLSTSGAKVHFERDPGLSKLDLVKVRLAGLKVEGYASVVWVTPVTVGEGGYEVGLNFMSLDGIDGNAYRYRFGG
jgi:hypothetical protein